MFSKLIASLRPSKIDSLAQAFGRLGWVGFWAQVVLGAAPLIMMVYVFAFSGSASASTRTGLPFVEYLSIASFLVLVFTTFWFFRYTRVARRLREPAARPSESSLLRTVSIGLVASTLGILFSMLVLLFEVGHMLFYFLSAPQAGVPTVQTTITGQLTSWVSAVDMMSLMSLILTLGAEVLALILGLFLLFRTMQASPALSAAPQ